MRQQGDVSTYDLLVQAPSKYSLDQTHPHQHYLLANRLKGDLLQLSSGANACDKNSH